MSIIKVENLSKKYVIGHDRNAGSAYRYRSLRDTVAHSARGFYQRLRHPLSPNRENTEIEEFWALKDLNFEIEPGDRVGIIGRNGAGKSTLLKILSRITEPTTGRIQIEGRVASLLEVGTGFHPELTGRENIYLNGALLGMKRVEIRKKFDQIVSFSEIEKFLDTPVKRYSSGMYVRLAFAVAAHLESEILIIDEILAVGDAEFQKKCLGKMNNVSAEGRTILFVSHQMNAVENVCSSGLILKNGRIEFESNDIRAVVNTYLSGENETEIPRTEWKSADKKHHNPYFAPQSFYLSNSEDQLLKPPVKNDQEIFVNIKFLADELDPALVFGYDIFDLNQNHIFACNQTDGQESEWPKIKIGYNHVRMKIPRHFLNEGDYHLRLVASLYNRMWLVNPFEAQVKIDLMIRGGLSPSPFWIEKRGGFIAPIFSWEAV